MTMTTTAARKANEALIDETLAESFPASPARDNESTMEARSEFRRPVDSIPTGTEIVRNSHVTREEILSLLSDDEVASLARGEVGIPLVHGDEYVDLAQPQNGIQRVHSTNRVKFGQILPRHAVPEATWVKIRSIVAQTVSKHL